MRTLIYCQTHIKNEAQGRLFGVGQALIERLNPGIERLVVDNASPLDPRRFAVGDYFFQFRESIGHFSPSYADERESPRDGPGRAHTFAWEMAFGLGYKRLVYIEADALFAKPIEWGFERMTKRIGCQPGEPKYQYRLDWHVIWISDLPWFVNELRFPERYAWETRTPADPAGEQLYEQIMGDDVEALPIRGIRGETVGLTGANFREHFPDGCELVTHVPKDAHAEFLRQAGHEDLIERL